MNDISNYETYLLISSKKLAISVNTELDKKIYYEELQIEDHSMLINFEKLDYFLNQNIFKIEKKFQNFIEKVIVILDLDIFFPIEISMKRKNFNGQLSIKSLNHILNEAKEVCKKTINQKKIIHMMIKEYKIDDESYTNFPEHINCNSFSLDIGLICISDNLIKDLENILKKYQIALKKVISANYIQDYSLPADSDIFSTAKKIAQGRNPNEIVLVEKTKKNQGFFEKFFNFFS